MSPKQTSLYWRLWRAACIEMHWRMIKGRLQIDRSQLNDEADMVVDMAIVRAKRHHRAPLLEDLRHGVHIVALGKDCSSKEIKPRIEFDGVKALLGVLAKPEDIKAITEWQHWRARGRARRVAHKIRTCQPAYVETVCFGKFGRRDWERLTDAQKEQLAMTLDNRPGSLAPATDSNEPF